jgi:hypothetical protein
MWPAAQLIKVVYEPGSALIETGTFRGNIADGMSTLLFGLVAKYLSTTLISVDIHLPSIAKSQLMCAGHPECSVSHVCQDSISYLSRHSTPIAFLYLDSMDYYEPTQAPQMHNFGEAAAAIGKMKERSVMLCDDARLPGGGKPHLTLPWLLERGWIVVKDDHQTLLANFDV